MSALDEKQQVADANVEVVENGAFKEDFVKDEAFDRRLIRKLDWKLLPFLSLLYLCSFLDRNAKLANITIDLNVDGPTYNWALSIFFIGYILFEIPSNLLMKKIGPRTWIPIVMVAWSLVMMCMVACKNAAGLLAARFFLGVAEAGLFPGVIFYLSLWYNRSEQASRVAIFFGAATVAGALGGLLAFGIVQMAGIRGLAGWQWLFILEGAPVAVIAIIAYFYLPDFPENSKFLNAKERSYLVARLAHDAGPASEKHFSWVQFKDAFLDWKVPFHCIIYICAAVPLYSLSLFLPSIINGMGFTNVNAQAMSAPPFAIACLALIIASISADRLRERGLHIGILMLLGMLGYILLIVLRSKGAVALYIAAVITTTGVFSNAAAMVTWFTINFGGHTKRGVATALMISFGNIGGALGGQVYRAEDAPFYPRGHTICACLMGFGALTAFVFKILLNRENRRRDNLTPEQYQKELSRPEPADWHPDWRYIS
ncbi:hypothetical protein BZG36_02616 [Bifiguratus adelaidae]|uniref:Major facilitator superfamily (MFS) profile domain-containing protein n=1 Tax=Bifiguratus adelaidae TaxID=1938954 RepID=A0A261Y2Q8_9FUNG|nr:hypothetical protein BZG36_02616 [Bifiguratus adelaidae]